MISHAAGQILDVRGLKASSYSRYQIANNVYERAELAA
jgi:hypothetical protein